MIEKNSSLMHRESHKFYAVHVYLQSIRISLMWTTWSYRQFKLFHFFILIFAHQGIQFLNNCSWGGFKPEWTSQNTASLSCHLTWMVTQLWKKLSRLFDNSFLIKLSHCLSLRLLSVCLAFLFYSFFVLVLAKYS